jgi:hypothetical protein
MEPPGWGGGEEGASVVSPDAFDARSAEDWAATEKLRNKRYAPNDVLRRTVVMCAPLRVGYASVPFSIGAKRLVRRAMRPLIMVDVEAVSI